MNDLAVIVDLLSVLTLRPYVVSNLVILFNKSFVYLTVRSLSITELYFSVLRAMWNLDLCNSLLGPINDLLQSKYEM